MHDVIYIMTSHCSLPFAIVGNIKIHSSVHLSVCHKNFNLAHIFWSIIKNFSTNTTTFHRDFSVYFNLDPGSGGILKFASLVINLQAGALQEPTLYLIVHYYKATPIWLVVRRESRSSKIDFQKIIFKVCRPVLVKKCASRFAIMEFRIWNGPFSVVFYMINSGFQQEGTAPCEREVVIQR